MAGIPVAGETQRKRGIPVAGGARPLGIPRAKTPEDTLDALEERAAESGSGTFMRGLKSAAGVVGDLLTAPGYAVVGAIEELGKAGAGPFGSTSPVPYGRAVERAGRELLSGLPGVELGAERRGVPEVLETLGVPEGASLSEVMPFAFSETGEGAPLKRGGALDVTTRGLLGFAGNAVTDPLTYVGTPASILARGSGKVGTRLAAKEAIPFIAEETAKLAPRAATAEGLVIDLAQATPRGAELASQAAREVASKRAIDSAVEPYAAELLKQGISETANDPISRELAQSYRALVRKEAEDRVLAAAAHDPSLLHRGGRTFMGREIPGTVALSAATARIPAAVTGQLSKFAAGRWALEKGRWANDLYDAIGSTIVPHWNIRHSPDFLEADARWRAQRAYMAAQTAREFEESGWGTLSKAAQGRVRQAREGVLDAAKLTGPEKDVLDRIGGILDDMRVQENVAGLSEGGRERYFPLIADNTDKDLALILKDVPGYRTAAQNIESLGRFNEVRHFKTREAALKWNAEQRRLDPSIPRLRLLDETQTMLQRIAKHAEAMAGKGYAEEIAQRFSVIPQQGWYDLTPSPLSHALTAAETKEYLAIKDAVTAGKTDPRFVAGLSDRGRSEFLRQRLARATSDGEVGNILAKYHEFADYLPKRLEGMAPGMVAFDSIPTLRGRLIPHEIAFDLQQSHSRIFKNRGVNLILERLGSINDFMRTSVYTVFPSSQFRNKYSNVATGAAAIGISYLDPRLQKQMLLLRYPKLRSILGDAGGGIRTKTGDFFSWGEIADMFAQTGVTVSGRQAVEQTGAGLTRGPRIAHKVAGTLENQDRAALGLHFLRNGYSPIEAAQRVNQWSVDYGDLTAFDREILRNLFLFPTYARKMIPNIGRAISQNPGRMSNMVRMFRGREAENQEMTSWEGEAFKLRLNRDGRNVDVLTGIDLPIRQLDTLWRGDASRTLGGLVGMGTPVFKLPAEYWANKSGLTDRQFSRTESATVGRLIEHAPKGVQDWLGFDDTPDAAGRPKYTFDGRRFYALFQSYAASRLISTSDRQFREYLNDDNWRRALLDFTTGVRFKTLNLDEEQRKKTAERIRLMQEAEARRGTGKYFQIYQGGR